MRRIAALMRKDLADLGQNPGVFLPPILTGLMAMALPFALAIGVPYFTGEPLSDSSDFRTAVETYRRSSAGAALDAEGAAQAWIFQQFLVLLALSPIAASMSVAAHSVIGEKQARTLEPLLATPITTFELLTAKVLGSLLPALVVTVAMFGAYVLGIALLGGHGVARMMLTPHPVAVMFVFAPLAALAALQLAVCVSSRVNDARSAQQIGALIILPIGVLLILQLTGAVVMTTTMVLAISSALVLLNAILMWAGIALFERETILTRWK